MVTVGFPDGVVDIHVDELVGAGQDRRHGRQPHQQAGSDPVQLPDVPEPVAAQMGAQRGRRPQTGEHPTHPAMAEHVQIADRVRAGDHARDDRRHLDRRVRPGRARHPHVLVDQVVQASLFGQRHHRRQPTESDQVRVVEDRVKAVADSHYECSCQRVELNCRKSYSSLSQEHSPSRHTHHPGGSRLRGRRGPGSGTYTRNRACDLGYERRVIPPQTT